MEDTKEHMRKNGFLFVDRIVGVTIRGYHYIDRKHKIHLSLPRGVEIKQWIDTHVHSDNGKEFARKTIKEDYTYVIIDDNSDMLLEHKDHFVQTNAHDGLTMAKAQEAIRILNDVYY